MVSEIKYETVFVFASLVTNNIALELFRKNEHKSFILNLDVSKYI